MLHHARTEHRQAFQPSLRPRAFHAAHRVMPRAAPPWQPIRCRPLGARSRAGTLTRPPPRPPPRPTPREPRRRVATRPAGALGLGLLARRPGTAAAVRSNPPV